MASKKHVFTQIEKKVFLEILKSHSTIIESKNTDSSTLREKNVAWNKITREYNASPHVTGEVNSPVVLILQILFYFVLYSDG